MNPFLANSRVNLRVIFSSSCSLYCFGSILSPALAPPNGTSTQAHLKVIRAERALTSSRETSNEYRIPVKNEKTNIKNQTWHMAVDVIWHLTRNQDLYLANKWICFKVYGRKNSGRLITHADRRWMVVISIKDSNKILAQTAMLTELMLSMKFWLNNLKTDVSVLEPDIMKTTTADPKLHIHNLRLR